MSVFRHDLKKILIQTEMLCGPAKKQKGVIREIVTQIEADMDLLFVEPGSIRRNEALILVEKIHRGLLDIQKICCKDLLKPGTERKSWRQNLNRTISATELKSDEIFDIGSCALTVTQTKGRRSRCRM